MSYVRHYDILGFIPNYKFFAPNPVQYDLVLLVRFARLDSRSDEELGFSEWVDLEAVCVRKSYFFFYNPYRRIYKSISDLFSALIRLGDDYDDEALSESTPARAIADYVRHSSKALGVGAAFLNDGPPGDATAMMQFAISYVEGSTASPTSSIAYVSKPERL
jgi:hypothetical protein